MKKVEIIYIGKNFYWDSGTIMSSIYDLNGKREDWGSVEWYLNKGITVVLRPATKEEIIPFEHHLKKLQKERKWINTV